MKKQKSYLFEILIGGFLLCVMIGVRFSYIYDYITAAYGDRRFLELALIRQDAGIPYFSSTLAGIYTGGLRLLFWFVGNKEMMAVYAQAVLQILTLSFFFLALERMCGVLLSAIVLLAVLFLDKGLWLMGELTPGNLLLLLGSVYFLFLAAAIPMATARWVLPVPGVPRNTTFPALSMNLRSVRASISSLFSCGWKEKS